MGKAASKANVQYPSKPANSETSLVGADGHLCLSPPLTERETGKSELGSPLLSDQPNSLLEQMGEWRPHEGQGSFRACC